MAHSYLLVSKFFTDTIKLILSPSFSLPSELRKQACPIFHQELLKPPLAKIKYLSVVCSYLHYRRLSPSPLPDFGCGGKV